MERRDWLKAAGGVGVAAVGGLGAYTVFFRDRTTPGDPAFSDNDDRNEDELREAAEQAETRNGDFLLGVSPRERDLTVLDPFEDWLDKRHAVVSAFIDVGHEDAEIDRLVHSLFEGTWNRGHVPHIFWQPFFPDRDDTSPSILTEIHEGEWDDRLDKWANELAVWATEGSGLDRRIFINLAPEFNGDWSPWSPSVGNDDEDDFVEMWWHVHDIVMDAGLDDDHVQWIWALDNTTRGVDREACWPGDDYVDWTAVHGYNWVGWDGWISPEEVYQNTIDVIRSITDKPIAITEFGCSSETEDGDNDPERKDRWIADAYNYFTEQDVKMTLWFNIDTETDWSVFDVEPAADTIEIDGREYGKYPAYRQAVGNDNALGQHPEHPRRLTDEEFWGEF